MDSPYTVLSHKYADRVEEHLDARFPEWHAQERCEKTIRRAFKKNTTKVWCTSLCEALEERYDTDQHAIAKKLGISRPTFGRWKEGKVIPKKTVKDLRAIAAQHTVDLPDSWEIELLAIVLTVSYVGEKWFRTNNGWPVWDLEEFEFLLETLLSDEWGDAYENESTSELEEAFEAIKENVHGYWWVQTRRVTRWSQNMYLYESWRVPFLVTIEALPFRDGHSPRTAEWSGIGSFQAAEEI